jgi:hypothetical protein
VSPAIPGIYVSRAAPYPIVHVATVGILVSGRGHRRSNN